MKTITIDIESVETMEDLVNQINGSLLELNRKIGVQSDNIKRVNSIATKNGEKLDFIIEQLKLINKK